jgi:hypothetical protein
VDGSRISAEHRLDAVGRYEPVLLISHQPITAPPEFSKHEVLEKAARQKIQVVTMPAVDVF